jgi:4-hydroxy 2-oxovalerate aldolase
MKKITILDCTLRDGGYVNDWHFGYASIQVMIMKLIESNIDIVECGFLSHTKLTNKDKSIFSSIHEVNAFVDTKKYPNTNLALMINYGEYPISVFPDFNQNSSVKTIRVAFHKKDLYEALDYCKMIVKKGFDVFVQPMVTSGYSSEELLYLMEKVEEMQPVALYIVDSFGTMRKKDCLSLYTLFDKKLKTNISIGFHSHNNLQLSFSNAQELIQYDTERELIIDASVFGMGRGAGNLCTELLTMYLNENSQKKYNIIPILEIVDDFLNPIFVKTPWGYSLPFYLASVNNCHPNYASFLLNKETLAVKAINLILSQIPDYQKQQFDFVIVESLYLNFQQCQIDDSKSLELLKKIFENREILVLAPGKTIQSYRSKIHTFIKEKLPLVVSVNFISQEYKTDIVFLSNLKRFETIITQDKHLEDTLIVATSNLLNSTQENFCFINYASVVNIEYSEIDNAGMMILKLMQMLNVPKVTLAGFDGYSANVHDNYFAEELIMGYPLETMNKRNISIAEQLIQFSKTIEIKMLTPSFYVTVEK